MLSPWRNPEAATDDQMMMMMTTRFEGMKMHARRLCP